MHSVMVDGLQMAYLVPVKAEGLRAAFRSLWHRAYKRVEAVRSVSFSVAPGEVVGFIGPNGAGKTTTLKILSGVLHPTAGRVEVVGHTPWERRPAYLRQIAMIRGSRPLAAPVELTVQDALRFQQLIYEVPEAQFRRTLGLLVEMLHLEPLLQRQIRALSLGEKMRAGLAWSLVYQPRVLFLDEPTLGLDVTAAQLMRRFVGTYSRETGATVLLTSHYMADVESLCRRILLIDKGHMTYDGDLAGLSARMAPFKLLKVAGGDPGLDWSRFGDVVEQEGGRVSLRVRREAVPAVTARLLAEVASIADLTVTEPPLESVIDQVYREGV
ncbi:MAG: transporter related [Symbiobacteriaceae bacterium]|nr:transporter related [Symbiobacteriaceae bacterium]